MEQKPVTRYCNPLVNPERMLRIFFLITQDILFNLSSSSSLPMSQTEVVLKRNY